MANAVKVFLLTLSALIQIVDPLTGSPIFLSLTGEFHRRCGEMLVQKDDAQEVRERSVQSPDLLGRALYPLTLPLTVGPGGSRAQID